MPASSINLPKSSIAALACSEAFKTTVLPAAKAGPNLTATKNSCEFHGTTAATTPRGSLLVKTNMSGLSIGRVSPFTLSAQPAKKWKKSAIYLACQRVSFSIFPVSTDSVRPKPSDCSDSKSPNFRRHLPRCVGVSLDHGPLINALCAVSTARFTSASVASGMRLHISPVVGFTLLNVPPSDASTQSPLINI